MENDSDILWCVTTTTTAITTNKTHDQYDVHNENKYLGCISLRFVQEMLVHHWRWPIDVGIASLSFTCDYDSHFYPTWSSMMSACSSEFGNLVKCILTRSLLALCLFFLSKLSSHTQHTQTHRPKQCQHKIDFKLSNSISPPISSTQRLSSK